MTRIRFPRFPSLLAAAAAAATAALLSIPSTALAGVTPSPSASYSLPGQGHSSQLREEAGDVLLSSGGVNTVNAYGPVAGLNGTDEQVTPTLDVFHFATGSVNVRHEAEGQPVLDEQTCSAIVVQRDEPWSFAGGTGADQGAQGYGQYTLVALYSFPVTSRGQCEFDQYGQLTGGLSDSPCIKDHGHVIRPLEFSTEIQFTGHARVHEQPQPCPCSTPTPVYTSPAPLSTTPAPVYSY
jgi:hypothetical protein